ncbi:MULTISPECIES: YiiX/YebB-like N1pC/P60 family cysteine hydrolase [Nitrosomonas]|uniref:YiiX/YebB-like N1pC/P60 family cysteine hydrolase n=2 Tax=Nitrosomonas TaxID=914 RepID=UPI000797C4A1|nr:YiiX/YebB-like N1pC/P60 family cysteine hydrolase [Nitrosomonas europaea]KXK43663.1 MAG: hypothetical protein UZ02_AOB001001224 [Nitrosomonas europaea]MBV6390384.1 hypothetical protein [Nitrosomonas europaea]
MVSGKLLLTSKAAWASTLLLVLSILQVGHGEMNAYEASPTEKSFRWEEVAGNLSDGDLVFRTGRDIMSRLVLSQGDSSRFSHVGIILKQESDLVVVHALPGEGTSPGGVLVEPLSVFAASDNASDIGFYRIKGIDANARNSIREYVLRQIGKPFDNDFLLSEDEKMYCTELVLKALSAAGISVVTSMPHIQVMLITEPVEPPDYLRRLSQIEAIAPNLASHSNTVR